MNHEFQFHVTDFFTAQKLMREGFPTHIVSLLGPSDTNHIVSSGPNHLVVNVEDTELQGEAFSPTTEMIAEVLEFTKQIEQGCLLVHCSAGMSRSPTVLAAILIQRGQTASEAVRIVKAIRPQAFFNRHMAALIDDLMGLDGQLNAEIEKLYEGFIIGGAPLPDRGGIN